MYFCVWNCPVIDVNYLLMVALVIDERYQMMHPDEISKSDSTGNGKPSRYKHVALGIRNFPRS
jgi:hypothetical protein